MIKTILYASDLGAYSAYSLAYVEQFAKQCDAKVLMLHVVSPLDAYSSAVIQAHCPKSLSQKIHSDGVDGQGVLATIREQAYERLLHDEFGVEFSHYLSDIVIERGQPAQAILNYAHNHPVDVLMIGRCSTPSEGTPMLGSVTQKVLQSARIPVHVVPLNAGVENTTSYMLAGSSGYSASGR